MKISVCGKGGSGKSTVASLLAEAAHKKGYAVLVVDSDESNSGIFRMLGFDQPPVPLMELVGGKAQLKERMRQSEVLSQPRLAIADLPEGYFQQRERLRLVSIGKILQSLEGCACPMGVLSREFLNKLHLAEKEIAVIDMEAGVEHFGRGIDQGIDQVLLVVEPSFESMTVAEKIRDLAAGMQKNVAVVLNKMPSPQTALKVENTLKQKNLAVIGVIPSDEAVFEACLEGLPFGASRALDAMEKVLDRLLRQ